MKIYGYKKFSTVCFIARKTPLKMNDFLDEIELTFSYAVVVIIIIIIIIIVIIIIIICINLTGLLKHICP